MTSTTAPGTEPSWSVIPRWTAGAEVGLSNLPSARSAAVTGTLIFLASWLLFLFRIRFPETPNFDEFHYLPSARQFLALTENQNYEHPPLGKELIALGMALFGDLPLGWRFSSSVFGALTIAGCYYAGLGLFRTQLSALFLAGITLFNQMVFVQSRIAMLDTFMAAFLVWAAALALVAFQPLWKDSNRIVALRFSGVALGLACATKWFAVVPWAALVTFATFQTLIRRRPRDFSRGEFFLSWIVIPVLVYYLTFIPFLWVTTKAGEHYGLADILIHMQWRAWDGQMRVGTSHPYASHWYQWPLMSRPIWYAFDATDDRQWVRGVALLANPVVIWGGLAALALTLWDGIRRKSTTAALIVGSYAACTLSWIVIPRKIAFFYYYYPAVLVLGAAIAYALKRSAESQDCRSKPGSALTLHVVALALTAGFFFYFYPILSAMKIPFDTYRDWMWFRSWI